MTGTTLPETSKPARVGWVVDVQNDFMQPTGRLYVHNLFDASDPGAVRAAPAIALAVQWMRAHCDVVVFTGDWHGYGDREIDVSHPDPQQRTYPPHCMGLSPDENERRGAAIVAEVDPGADVVVLPRDADAEMARRVAASAVRARRSVFIQKSEFSVFDGNPATDTFLRALRDELGRPLEFIVCGVATDVCVKGAVDGLLDRALQVRVLPDATWSLGLLGPEETFDLWQRRGALVTPVLTLTAGN
jgi:nicotinamidase-related amidase